jgi:hypothetical protein
MLNPLQNKCNYILKKTRCQLRLSTNKSFTILINTIMDFLKLVADVGFPIAAALAAGYFVFLTLKFILAGVTSSVNGMAGIIKGLDARVDTMTNDLQRVDVKISHALGLQPDYYRISRAEQADQRRD